jgi:hypothetical protein
MAKKLKYATREQWLAAAVVLIDKQVFRTCMPKKWRVTCGWPSLRAMSAKNTRIGECWDKVCSPDQHFEIIISMRLDDVGRVLDTLTHEMVHAVVGCAAGHKGPFKKLARSIGLEGKLTATHAGPQLTKQLDKIARDLGPYPHAKLDIYKQHKKQSTRLIKCECGECGYTVRTTRKWIDEAGAPLCPCNGETMMIEEGGESDEE